MLIYRWPKPGARRYLLVHGIGLGHRTFDRMIEALSPCADVIAVDLPGFGDAPEPRDALSMAATAELLAAVLDEADIEGPLVAIGHSMGAQVVTELALARPDLVDRLVLLAPAVHAAERTAARQALRLLQDVARGKPLFVMVRGVIEYVKTGPRWFVKKLGPTLEHQIEVRVARVQQPTLVICGDEDLVTPPTWCVSLAKIAPHGQFQMLPGSGHEAMIARGDEVADLVDMWLRAG